MPIPIRRVPGPLLALAALLAACAGATDVEVAEPVTVELDAFSGRPNPTWTLDPGDVAGLRDRLADLPPATDGAAPETGLGYRGFVVVAGGARIRVAGGTVRVGEPGTEAVYRDAHDLEGWLLERARRQGHGPVLPAGPGAAGP